MSSKMDNDIKMNVFEKPLCPCCNSVGTRLYLNLKDKLFGAPGVWDMSQCVNKDCGLIWLDPAPASSDLYIAYQNYYTHTIYKNKEHSFFKRIVRGYQAIRFDYLVKEIGYFYQVLGLILSAFSFVREHMNFPFVYLKNKSKGRLLEIGVGSGGNLKKFINWGWNAEGLDFDPKAIEACKALGLNVMNGDLLSQNFSDKRYDAIFSSHVIEHVPDPVALLKESFRVLVDGGVFVAITPNANSLLHNIFKRTWRGLEPPRHLHIFTGQALRNIATSSGFKSVEIYSSNLSSAEIFMYSLALKIKTKPGLLLKLISFIVRVLLNFYRTFSPMSGEELVLIAHK